MHPSRHFARLPPLDLVRGFVAVGRRLSITLAAKDLNLTQSAVSRQVRTLEETLGVRLLKRGYRSVEFTSEGARLFRTAEGAIREIDQVAREIGAATKPRLPVTITASVGVSSLWVLPRLSEFQRLHPLIDVRLTTENKFLDLGVEDIDIAIRCCAEAHITSVFTRLFPEAVVPVGHDSLRLETLDADTIERNVLIEFDAPQQWWLRWSDRLSAMGLDQVKPRGVLRLNQYNQVIEAALAGQGIALGRMALIEPLLAQKRLIVPAGEKPDLGSGCAYWLGTANSRSRQEVQIVADWIKSEAYEMERRISHYG